MFNKIKAALATISWAAGKGVSFFTLLMVLTMFSSALLSNLFSINFIALQESVTWIHALVFMLGAAYTLQQNEHVRVDIFYHRFSVKTRAIIDITGTVLFLWPLCGFILYSSWRYVELSWKLQEASAEAGGLPGVFLLKTLVLVMPVLLIIEGLHQVLLKIEDIRSDGNTPSQQNKDDSSSHHGVKA